MGFRAERHPKEKATYLVGGKADYSRVLSLDCGQTAIEFAFPRPECGVIYVAGGGGSSEYEVASSDFVVTVEGLRAARMSVSQKSVPSDRFDLDAVLGSEIYKKISDIGSLARRSGSRFHIAYDRDGYAAGLVGNVRGACILVGFVLLERHAAKSGADYGTTLARFGSSSYIR